MHLTENSTHAYVYDTPAIYIHSVGLGGILAIDTQLQLYKLYFFPICGFFYVI